MRDNIFYSGSGNWLVTVPVSAADNVNNKLDYNLSYLGVGSTLALWSWNNTQRTGFPAWKTASAQNTNSFFADPGFTGADSIPDLHLRLDSPAIDTGNPSFTVASGETDIDAALRLTGTRVDIGANELAPIDSWRYAKFGINATNTAMTAATATPAGDGIRNLIKYALALDPLHVSTAGLPRVQTQPVNDLRYLALQFTHAPSASDITCTVQTSDDCVHWSDGSRYGAAGDLPANSFTTEVSRTSSNGVETITVRDNTDIDSAPRRFMRVRVAQP